MCVNTGRAQCFMFVGVYLDMSSWKPKKNIVFDRGQRLDVGGDR